jgi:hypothetical protein
MTDATTYFVLTWHALAFVMKPCEMKSGPNPYTGIEAVAVQTSQACFDQKEKDMESHFKTKAEAQKFVDEAPKLKDYPGPVLTDFKLFKVDRVELGSQKK